MTKVITLDGYKIVYDTTEGTKNGALLMIHGWRSHRGVWQQTMAAFKEDYHCVAIDLLGFGDSDKPPNADYGIAAQGERILQLADALGLDKFSLMGHSMGGQIALYIAAVLAPERIEKLVDVAGVVSRVTPSFIRLNYPFIKWAKAVPQLYSLLHYFLQYDWFMRRAFKIFFYNIDTIPLKQLLKDRDAAFQRSIHISAYVSAQAIRHLHLERCLTDITAPTLIIFGQQDAVVAVSEGHTADEKIKNSRIVLLDECGHFPMYEKTAQYIAELKKFLLTNKA